nr:hypothetical protein [Thermoguttaceae bacterium]
MKNMNRDLPDDLNQLFQEWQAFSSRNSLEGLASFLAQHPTLSDEERKSLLYVILSDLYGAQYNSGSRMSVNQYLKKLAEWPDYASLGLDPVELTRHCLEVYFYVSAQEPDIEDLCLAYPAAADFIQEFAEKNRDWLFPSQATPEGGKLTLGDKESISENYKVLEFIGHGGQKEVYTVTQQSTGQTLALKVPSKDEGGKDAFISEANIQAGLSHQGIPAVFSLAFGPDVPTRLVERYIDGT